MMTPPINYMLLGEAVKFYRDQGFQYLELPWTVDDEFIAATLDSPCRSLLVDAERIGDGPDGSHQAVFSKANCLVGSAEQSFLTKIRGLDRGRYFACTPCFRTEPKHDLLHQPYFMKVELLDTRHSADFTELMDLAALFMRKHGKSPTAVRTAIGTDLMINGVEVGSYGKRAVSKFGTWHYGTGLALPRFTVANAFAL